MFFERLRPIPLPRAIATLLCGVVLLSLLFSPRGLPDENRLVFAPRPELEVLLLVALLAVTALMGRALALGWRIVIALLLSLGALLNVASGAVPSFLERPLDLYLDLRHVPNLILMFIDASGPVRGWASVAAVALVLLLLPIAIVLLLRAMERALRGRGRAEVALALSLIGSTAALLPPADDGPYVSVRMSREIAQHTLVAWRSFRIMNGAPGPYGVALDAPEPPASDLAKLRRRDVYLVFFESYGMTVLDDPRFAGEIKPALEDFEASVRESGYYIVSNRIDSPTFGGGSWLAHGTIASGLKLDELLYQLLLTTKRETLAKYMAAAGYRTLAIMPGLKYLSPGEDFWGFERTVTARDLPYQGPVFGWFAIPDQWTLKVALERVDQKPHGPLFAEIVLVSSHTPFAPVPPYLDDWSNVGPYNGIPQAEWDRIYRDPDWWHLEQPYIASIEYDLKVLAGWLNRLKGQPLVIILGDHQPPGFVSGDHAPHSVPIHVLSRDDELVLPFTDLGYVPGAIPPEHGEVKGMETFLPDFLRLFASGRSVAAR